MLREFPLTAAAPASLGLDERQLNRLRDIIVRHVAERRYPGGQVAVARHGKLAMTLTVGDAQLEPRAAACDEHVVAALFQHESHHRLRDLAAGRGRRTALFRPNRGTSARVRRQWQRRHHRAPAAHAPGRISQCRCSPAPDWQDHERLRKVVSGFTLEWTPGSRVSYHPFSAHWVAAVLVEAIGGIDYRRFIRRAHRLAAWPGR